MITAGTYVWTAVAVAVANGDPCCGAQSAESVRNVWLQLDPAPAIPVPVLGPLSGAVLAAALGGLGAARIRRGVFFGP